MYRVLRYLRVMERVQAAERSKSDTASPPDGPFCMLPASESLSGIQRRGTRRKTRVSRLFTGKPEQHFPTSDMSRIQSYPFNHPTDPMMRSEPTSSVYCYNFGINLLVRRHHRASQTLSQISLISSACSSRASLFAGEHLRQAHHSVVLAVLRPRNRPVFVQRQHRLDVSQRPPGRLDRCGLAVD